MRRRRWRILQGSLFRRRRLTGSDINGCGWFDHSAICGVHTPCGRDEVRYDFYYCNIAQWHHKVISKFSWGIVYFKCIYAIQYKRGGGNTTIGPQNWDRVWHDNTTWNIYCYTDQTILIIVLVYNNILTEWTCNYIETGDNITRMRQRYNSGWTFKWDSMEDVEEENNTVSGIWLLRASNEFVHYRLFCGLERLLTTG